MVKRLSPRKSSSLPRTATRASSAAWWARSSLSLAVALKPRYGAYLVAAWLGGIIVNLLTYSGYYDIALRDFGLMLGR